MIITKNRAKKGETMNNKIILKEEQRVSQYVFVQEIRRRVLIGDEDNITFWLLSKQQKKLLKEIIQHDDWCSSSYLRSLREFKGMSIQHISTLLKQIHDKGYLDRRRSSSLTGGAEYFYTYKRPAYVYPI